MMSWPIIIFFFVELIVVSYLDIKYKKISNYWIIFNLIMSFVFYLLLPDIYRFEWELFYYPLGFLMIGFLLFAMNLMGAGDAKFLFSFYLMIPYQIHSEYFTSLLVVTIIVSGFNLLYRAFNNREMIYGDYLMKNFSSIKKIMLGKKMTYAPVIMLAWGVMLLDFYYDIF